MFGSTSKLLVPLATMVVAGAVTIGSGATWTSETTKSSTVSAGEVIHTDNGLATLNLADLKPGDVMSGTVTITNTGSIDSYLRITETASTNLFTSPENVHLRITADKMTAPLYDGTFGGLDAEALEVKSLGTTNPFVLTKPVSGTPGVAGGAVVLTFKVTLAANAPATDQNKTAGATYSVVTVPAAGETGLAGAWN